MSKAVTDSAMLGMKYIDRNGNEWSIDNGDWSGYQDNTIIQPNRRVSFIKIGLVSIAFFAFVLFSLI